MLLAPQCLHRECDDGDAAMNKNVAVITTPYYSSCNLSKKTKLKSLFHAQTALVVIGDLPKGIMRVNEIVDESVSLKL